MLDFNKETFFIFAHPDDESFYAGGIINISSKKTQTTVICLTKGEKAKSDLSEKDLAQKRNLEFNKACQILGAQNYQCLNFGDGQIKNQEKAIKKELSDLFKNKKDYNVFTFAEESDYLHKDHISTQKIVTEICDTGNLFYVGTPKEKTSDFRNSRNKSHEHYDDNLNYLSQDIFEICFLEKKIFDTKIKALNCHTSQNPESLIDYLRKQKPIEMIFRPRKID